MEFNTIEEAIEDIRQGKMIVVVDDEDRENEGDLLMAADAVTPEAINFMATYGRGLICVPMLKDRLNQLNIGVMVAHSTDPKETAFTVSVDSKETHTGISAHERALTVQRLMDPTVTGDDFTRPGHIFPLIAKEGGVLERTGHTEAAIDLPKLAGRYPAGVICEIMNDDGTMARVKELKKFVKTHDLKLITIADLIRYRYQQENLVEKVAKAKMPTKYGDLRCLAILTN